MILGANCIYHKAREKLFDALDEVEGIEDDMELNMLIGALDQLPDCFEIEEPLLVPGKKVVNGELVDIKPKKPRKLSEYNLFVQKCAKGTGKSFKDCVLEWKQVKSKMLTGK